MKVAFLTGSLSRQGGGFFPILQRLSRELMEHGAEVEVFGTLDQDYALDRESWLPVSTHPFETLGPARLAYAPGIKDALRNYEPKLVHLHGLWMTISESCHRWHRQTKRPYMISAHGMMDPWALRNGGWKKRLVGFLYENRNLRDAACLHALSKQEVEQYREYGLRNPIAVIPNGVGIPNTSDDEAAPPWKDSVPDQSKILFFLGRLHPKKGILELMQGWQQARAGREHWKLVIGGWDDGGYEAVIRKHLTEMKLQREVFLIGPQFGAMKEACFRNADAFILPSHSEGLPVAVLEAWAYGLPVLITPACNLPIGFSRGAALWIEPKPERIAAGLEKLLAMSDQTRIEMGNEGRKLAGTDFSWPQIARQMSSVYKWLLGEGPKPECVQL